MKIAKLLQLHSAAAAANSLADNFGDGFLCQNNRIFSNIRKHNILNSYRFSTERNDFYLSLPLSQLENILTSKCVPYSDNVSVLQSLESKYPAVTDWDDIVDNLKRNFLFHESCHAVARSEASLSDTASQKSQVLQMLLEESYANTCELLGVIDAVETGHQIFYEINSYTSLFDQRAHIKNALQEVGAQRLFLFIMLNYLHSNFLYDKLLEVEISRIFKLADIEISNNKKLKHLSQICFTLDERFKYKTTSFYMRLHGLKMTKGDLLKFDFMAIIENNKEVQSYLNRIAAIAVSEIAPR